MRSRARWAAVLAATVTIAAYADQPTAPWEKGLPRVEATKTEVGPAQYLWGSTLLLAVPDKFQGYWPDYGYRWSDATYIELCGGSLTESDGESPDLGRVRLVAESGDEAEHLVGVELRTQGGEPAEVAEEEGKEQHADAGFSVEELCALLDESTERQRLKSVVTLMAATGINFLTTGTWDRKTVDFEKEMGLKVTEYVLLWFGSGVYEGVDTTNKVSWSAKGKPVVIWNSPSVVKLHKGYGKIPAKVFALHDAPGYVLTSMGGGTHSPTLDEAAGFEVTKGAIDDAMWGNTDQKEGNIQIGMLEVWANLEKYYEMRKLPEPKLWLVTENVIPMRSLVPDIRVGKKK